MSSPSLRSARLRCLAVALLVLFSGLPVSAEEVRVSNVAGLRKAAAEAKPGTRILLAPGNYQGGVYLDKLRGEAGKPIVIAAEDPARPPVFRDGREALHLSSPQYVELHHLQIIKMSGNGLNIDDGGSMKGTAHHVLLRGLRIADIGPAGNHDGLKLSGQGIRI